MYLNLDTAAMTGDGKTVNRLRTADVLKGILIVGIVFVHLFYLNLVDDAGRTADYGSQIAYMGLMGFFIIAGYFIKPGRSFSENVRHRVGKLGLVLVLWALVLPVVMYAVLLATGQAPGTGDLFDSILSGLSNYASFLPVDSKLPNLISYTEYANYFIWLVFWSAIVLYALPECANAERRPFIITLVILLAAAAALCYLGLRLPFAVNLLPLAAAFALAGTYMSRHHVLEVLEEASLGDYRTWIPLLVSAVAAIVMIVLLPPGIKFNFNYFGEYGGLSVFPYFIEGMLVFVFGVYVALLLSKVPAVSSILIICGRHTLALAIFHVFLVKVVYALFATVPTDVPLPVMTTVETIIVGIIDIVAIVCLCELWEKVILVHLKGKKNPVR